MDVQGSHKGDLVALHLENGEMVYGKITGIGLLEIDIEEYSVVYVQSIFMASLSEWKLAKLNKVATINRGLIVRIEIIKTSE
jgi:hypothetical protein